jgi:hypothetical protein
MSSEALSQPIWKSPDDSTRARRMADLSETEAPPARPGVLYSNGLPTFNSAFVCSTISETAAPSREELSSKLLGGPSMTCYTNRRLIR